MCQSNSGSARRRQFLKRSSVVTASVFSLGIGSKRTLAETANGEEVRYIKYLHGEPKNGGRKAIYDTIRFDEWARKSTAANVADRIERQILNRFGTVQVAVAFGVDEDSPTGFGVEIQYITRHRAGGETTEPSIDIDRLRREFESFSKGIAKRKNKEVKKKVPVRVVKKNEKNLSGCTISGQQMDQYTLDNVPGGVDISTGYNAPYDVGSITAPFNDGTHGDGWISSGHVPGRFGEGKPARQGDALSQDKIGTVKISRNTNGIDFCFIKSKYNKTGDPRVANPSDMRNTDYPIGGIVTRNRLKNKVGTDEVYYSQGKASSRLSGTIIKLRSFIGSATQVITTHDTREGDSGGLLFGVDDNNAYAYVAAELQSKYDEDGDGCQDETVSTLATTIENKRNGFFRSV